MVKAETVTELERKVNDFLGAGWDISDGFCADDGNFFQPMIHKKI